MMQLVDPLQLAQGMAYKQRCTVVAASSDSAKTVVQASPVELPHHGSGANRAVPLAKLFASHLLARSLRHRKLTPGLEKRTHRGACRSTVRGAAQPLRTSWSVRPTAPVDPGRSRGTPGRSGVPAFGGFGQRHELRPSWSVRQPAPVDTGRLRGTPG